MPERQSRLPSKVVSLTIIVVLSSVVLIPAIYLISQ